MALCACLTVSVNIRDQTCIAKSVIFSMLLALFAILRPSVFAVWLIDKLPLDTCIGHMI